MNTGKIKKTELQNELNHIPENKLDDVKNYFDAILDKSRVQHTTAKNLSGIWKDKGFEKLKDLEKEIHHARKDLSESIIKKYS